MKRITRGRLLTPEEGKELARRAKMEEAGYSCSRPQEKSIEANQRFTFSVDFGANTELCGEEIYTALRRVIWDASQSFIDLRDGEIRVGPLEPYDELP